MDPTKKIEYNVKNLESPFLSGKFAAFAINYLFKIFPFINNIFIALSGFYSLRSQRDLEDIAATNIPLIPPHESTETVAKQCDISLQTIKGLANKIQSTTKSGWQPSTCMDYYNAYKQGKSTPNQLIQKLLTRIDNNDDDDNIKSLNTIFTEFQKEDVLRQAEASTKRWQLGKPWSMLDGVPCVVKDELSVKGYTTWLGTNFYGKLVGAATKDSDVAKRMRAMGMIILGKSTMHEVGIGTNGSNAIWGTPRNPYNPKHHTGGSSTGSAAVVAAGICPIACGGDGGGSVRIPSALSGVVGIKATFARIPTGGSVPLAPSVGHIGPIAATVLDCAMAYLMMASPVNKCNDNNNNDDDNDYSDDNHKICTKVAPKPHLFRLDQTKDLSDLTAGIYTPYFEHADPRLVQACRDAITKLQTRGLKIVEIEIAELEQVRVAHTLCILTEMGACLGSKIKSLQHSSQLSLTPGTSLKGIDRECANKVRTKLIAQLKQIFRKVDMILTPTTGILAPEIPLTSNGEEYDYLNSQMTGEIMRFAQVGNLSGIPGISVPCGYSTGKLPCALQIQAEWYREDICFRVAKAVEEDLNRLKPEIFCRVLEE